MSYREELQSLYDAEVSVSKNPVTTLAAKIGTCEKSIKRWLNGASEPRYHFRIKIHLLMEELHG